MAAPTHANTVNADSLLFFFLLVVVIFCNCGLFAECGDSLLFFFLLLAVILLDCFRP